MKWQIIGLLAPTGITQLVTFYLIKKLRIGLLFVLTWVVASAFSYLLGEFIGTSIVLTSYAVMVYLGIRWCLEWNKKIDQGLVQNHGQS